MNRDSPKKPNKKDSDEETERHLRMIHTLAARLPWIVVVIVFISMLLIMLEVYLRHQST